VIGEGYDSVADRVIVQGASNVTDTGVIAMSTLIAGCDILVCSGMGSVLKEYSVVHVVIYLDGLCNQLPLNVTCHTTLFELAFIWST
jgi:hypothetical protein